MNINYTLILNYWHQGSSLFSYYSFIPTENILFFLAAILSYIILFSRASHIIKKIFFIMLPFYFSLIIASAAIINGLNITQPSTRFLAIYTNPFTQIALGFQKNFNVYNHYETILSGQQRASIRLIGPLFSSKFTQKNEVFPAKFTTNKEWNVVVFVLESVGNEAAFQSISQQQVMPFLQKMASMSLWLNNNYSGGNISALGQFSIFTGLYPNPTPTHFEMNDALQLPTIASWLGKNYDSFLISASNNLYFSMGNNRTFKEYDNAARILAEKKSLPQHLYFNMFLDESTAFQFFLARINHAKKPFLGVYWSGAAHFPYQDYSATVHFMPQKTAYARYLNNLHLLDEEIKTLFLTLQQKKLLDHTIIVIVGDHGELFGEHGMNIHGKSLYQSEIKTPAIIYAPQLIPAHKINVPTSSIDILPTLLTALNIKTHDQLQGESLLQPNYRHYVFIYSDQDALASIDNNGNKMQVSFADGTCHAVNVKKDPDEKNILPCTDQMQLHALLEFRHIQPWILTNYNAKYSLALLNKSFHKQI